MKNTPVLMKALVVPRYASPPFLELQNLPVPEPSEGQLLVRVHAFSINPLDVKLASGSMRLLLRKKIPWVPGCDFSGMVVGKGPGVAGFEEGDWVFGGVDPFRENGPMAEFVVVSAHSVVPVPTHATLEQTAGLPVAGLSAMHVLHDMAGVAPGSQVLVNGAAGGLGHCAVQLAKHAGAMVTAVCSAGNKEFVLSLGADRVVDYGQEDFTRLAHRYDLVFDTVSTSSWRACRRILAPGGLYVATVPGLRTLWEGLWSAFSGTKAKVLMLRPDAEKMQKLKEVVENGGLRLHIDTLYEGLENAAAAFEKSRTGRVKGKLVVRVA